ncbi:MAG: hypothetical protein FJ194_15365 [Gammaproteobacteria bacterium]|nr:hypothetical protein [Gammaproteobacteria bacterium]
MRTITAIFILASLCMPVHASTSAAESGSPVIYTAREFITMDPTKPRASAVAVRDGKFIAVGTLQEVKAAAGATATIDAPLSDKVAIAGFIDQHVHPMLASMTTYTEVISIEDWEASGGFSPGVRDRDGYRQRLQAAIDQRGIRTEPLLTWGYHHYFHGGMSRELLNEMAKDLPVIV